MKLIADWRRSWRWASVRLAVVAGALSGWAASDPASFMRIVDLLPPWARPLVGIAVTLAALSARLTTKGTKFDGY